MPTTTRLHTDCQSSQFLQNQSPDRRDYLLWRSSQLDLNTANLLLVVTTTMPSSSKSGPTPADGNSDGGSRPNATGSFYRAIFFGCFGRRPPNNSDASSEDEEIKLTSGLLAERREQEPPLPATNADAHLDRPLANEPPSGASGSPVLVRAGSCTAASALLVQDGQLLVLSSKHLRQPMRSQTKLPTRDTATVAIGQRRPESSRCEYSGRSDGAGAARVELKVTRIEAVLLQHKWLTPTCVGVSSGEE